MRTTQKIQMEIQLQIQIQIQIQIDVIGIFIQLGALYKDHPALLLPSSKRLRQPCIVHNYRLYIIHIYVQLYTHTYNYTYTHIQIYAYTYVHIYTHTQHKYEHIVPFLRGHPQKLNKRCHQQKLNKRGRFTVCLQKSSSLVKPFLLLQATHINFICPMRFDAFPLDTQVYL